jgi:hypothetical protein
MLLVEQRRVEKLERDIQIKSNHLNDLQAINEGIVK